jgi:hypothetical protein
MSTVLEMMRWVSLFLLAWTGLSVASTLPLVALLRSQSRWNQRDAGRATDRRSVELAWVQLSR